MRLVLSLIVVVSLAGSAHAQWRDICPENHVDGEELVFNATVSGTPAHDEGVTDLRYLTVSANMYGAPGYKLRVFTNGFLTHRYVDRYTIGSTATPRPMPYEDGLELLIAPFWADLLDVRACLLEEAEKATVQWTGVTAQTGQVVQFQASLNAVGEIRLEYGPEHDPEASELASIGIEDVSETRGVDLSYFDPGAAEPMTGYLLVPDDPLWADEYTPTPYLIEGYDRTEDSCDDETDNDGDELIDCSDPDCEGNEACTSTLSIAAGWRHTCVTTDQGGVRCWGDNRFGQLGYGHRDRVGDDETPISEAEVDVGGTVVQLAAGAYHTCALLETGNVTCWGRNRHGELGYGHRARVGDNETPASVGHVDLGGAAVEITAGKYHTCALLDTGAARCWGRNREGQLGYGHRSHIGDNENPGAEGDIALDSAVIQVVAGKYHTCALLDTKEVRCWGLNRHGQLGLGHTRRIGDNEQPTTEPAISVGADVLELTAGNNNVCALLDGGRVRCWGKNRNGELGYGTCENIGDDETPADVGDIDVGGSVVQIKTGRHTCAILDSGSLRCWGKNRAGQLGYGHRNNIGDDELPSSAGDVPVGGLVTQVAIGRAHTCVFLDTGVLRCWGANNKGQLGLGHDERIGDDEPAEAAGDVEFQ